MYSTRDTKIHSPGGNDPVCMFYGRPLDMEKSELDTKSCNVTKQLDYCSRSDIAIIAANNDVDGISSVRYQPLGISNPSPIANVESYHYIPSCSRDLQQDDYYFGCVKAGLKTQKSLNKVLEFFSGSNTNGEGTGMTVGKSVIVERLEVERKGGEKMTHDGGKAMINFTQYCETICTIRPPFLRPFVPNLLQPSPNDIQFFNLRSSSLKAKDKIKEFSSINILSGICLFSQEHLGYSHGDSESFSECADTNPIEPSDHLIPLPFDRRPTFYEIESLIRLPNAIANIVSILPAALNVTITLDVPRAQYYAFFLDLYAEGRCSREYIDSWLGVIDRRHDQLAEVFVKAIRDALQRRGIDRKNVQIELSTGLEEVVPDIRETIDHGSALSVEDLLQKILERDPLFREYYEYLPQSQRPPHNLVNLCFTSYSYQILRPILRRVHEQKPSALGPQKQKSPDRQLLIHIDNPAEWRIYSQAEKILKEYRKKHSSIINPLLLGMFPSELVFTAGNTGRTSLYLRNIGQYIYDESARRVVSPSDVLERVYGRDVTRRVVGWMRQEGMFDVSAILTAPGDNFPSSGSSNGGDETGTPPTELDSGECSMRIAGKLEEHAPRTGPKL